MVSLDENKKKELVESMVRGKLHDVIDAYVEYPEARQLKINRTGDTALHIAISDEWNRFAEKMVSAALTDTLAIGNEHGDTALHLAAKLGNTYLCKLIAEKDVSLVGKSNESGETPLFSAVSSGKTQAFLYLYHLCKDSDCLIYGRYTNTNGDSILHAAIFEDHFDLAYIIIIEYPEMVNEVNKEGLSPLHLLATKPSVFQSGIHLFGFRKLFYHCVRVQKLAQISGLVKAPHPEPNWDRHFRPRALIKPSESLLESCYKNICHKQLRFLTILLVAAACYLVFCTVLLLLFLLYWLLKPASVEVMNELVPDNQEKESKESIIFIAAKHGISEMVSCILDANPGAILDVNAEKKNIVMLAVEHRHTRLYEYLITHWDSKKTIFGRVDADGNSLLHIAASNLKPGQQFWRIPGAALQMHMEIKWYKFIKKSMPPRFFARHNGAGQTPKDVFQKNHELMIKEGREWLTNASQSCSFVAALIATVTFATSATVPGGLKGNGVPSLEHNRVFIISAASSLIALSSSMVSVVMFLGILTSNFKIKDFRKDLPYKLLLGLIFLLISIVSMFISFYAGHYFVLKQELHHNTTLVYLSVCVPLLLFTIFKFPIDFEIVWTTLSDEPRN